MTVANLKNPKIQNTLSWKPSTFLRLTITLWMKILLLWCAQQMFFENTRSQKFHYHASQFIRKQLYKNGLNTTNKGLQWKWGESAQPHPSQLAHPSSAQFFFVVDFTMVINFFFVFDDFGEERWPCLSDFLLRFVTPGAFSVYIFIWYCADKTICFYTNESYLFFPPRVACNFFFKKVYP